MSSTIGADDISSSPLFQFLLAPQKVKPTTMLPRLSPSFKRAYVRLGVGYSTIPYSWLLQSIDFTWFRWKNKATSKQYAKDMGTKQKGDKEGGDKK